MKRNYLFILSLAVLAALFPATAQCGLFYQFAGLPVAPVAPGTEVHVQVLLSESGTNAFDTGIIAAAVEIAPVPGLVLTSITPGADWIFTLSDLPTGYWDGATNPGVEFHTAPALLATYSFIANQTATITAIDPLALGDDGSAVDANLNYFLIGDASGTITVVPEPSTLVGLSLGLAVLGGCGWVKTRRLRRC